MSVNEIVIGMFSAQDIARRYNVPYPTVFTVVDRVNVSRRVGQMRVILAKGLPLVEAGLRKLGWKLPLDVQQEESVEQ
jgi:hypothetical protein